MFPLQGNGDLKRSECFYARVGTVESCGKMWSDKSGYEYELSVVNYGRLGKICSFGFLLMSFFLEGRNVPFPWVYKGCLSLEGLYAHFRGRSESPSFTCCFWFLPLEIFSMEPYFGVVYPHPPLWPCVPPAHKVAIAGSPTTTTACLWCVGFCLQELLLNFFRAVHLFPLLAS